LAEAGAKQAASNEAQTCRGSDDDVRPLPDLLFDLRREVASHGTQPGDLQSASLPVVRRMRPATPAALVRALVVTRTVMFFEVDSIHWRHLCCVCWVEKFLPVDPIALRAA
jgi:hypothetical protein